MPTTTTLETPVATSSTAYDNTSNLSFLVAAELARLFSIVYDTGLCSINLKEKVYHC